MKLKFKTLLGLVALTIGIGTLPANAGFNQGNWVTFSGEPMFQVKSGAAGLSAERRAWVAQDNLDNALAVNPSKSPSTVQVCKVNGGYTVQVGGKYILTADADSARMENMSALELANAWAGAIKDRLANRDDSQRYIATLRDEHALKANVSVTETDIVRSREEGIPFRMAEGTLTMSPDVADQCILVLKKNVVLQNGYLPERSILTGVISKDGQGEYVTFTQATTPAGHTVKLTNVVASAAFSTDAPHPVLTLNMPANPQTSSREPALVGVGAQESNIAVIEERNNMVAVTTDDLQM
jgi:predicted component of type VI protein secretion system